MSPLQRILCASVLLGLFAYEYAPVLQAGFVYQDYRWMDSCAERGDTVPTPAWDVRVWPRSLMRWSWCAQARQSPRAFHLVNLGLHLIVSLLLGVLIWRLCGMEFAAWAGAGCFLVLRLNIEAVAYVSGRSELLAAIGILCAGLAVLSDRWLLALAACALGVLGKESAIVVLPLLPLLRGARRATGLLAGVMVAVVLGLTRDWPALSLSWMRLQAMAAMRLTAMLVLPLGQTVDTDYAHVAPPIIWLGAGLFVATAVFAWQLSGTPSLLSLSLGWLVLSVLPRLCVVTPGMALSEHQFYTPAMSLPFAVAALLHARPNPR